MSSQTLVVAIGGNSLIRDARHMTVPDQVRALGDTSAHIASIIRDGWHVAIGHGNGPQVGFILRRSELSAHELHEVPLDVCDADTQGAIGYELQQNLGHDFRRLGIDRRAVTVVTQVEVAGDDPAFQHPAKPIGSFMDEATAARRRDEEGWAVREDAGRGWRRVVPSPRPLRIVELDAVRALLRDDFVVITVGGGGIPVVADEQGDLHGVAAVIDKDYASALLAIEIRADVFMISTAVPQVALDWGRPEQRWVDRLTVGEARRYLAEGSHFGAGSMQPKIEACLWYLERRGGRAIITSPDQMELALEGRAGTEIVPG
jgi:carbamate kinase